MANTKIGARLESVASDGIVAGADAIYDDELSKSQAEINQGISDLAEKANYVGITTLDSEPTSSTLTYTVGTETRNFKVGDEVRVADANSSTGYKFYKLNAINVTNAGEENETTSAVWQELGSGASGDGGGSADLSDVAFIGDTEGSASSPSFDPVADTVHTTAQVLTTAQKAQARENIDAASADEVGNVTYTEDDEEIASLRPTLYTNALRKTAQTLTPAEKLQVRTNLGLDSAYLSAASASNYLTISSQELTAEQKAQVKTNLGIAEYSASQVRNITFSTSEPTSSDGSNGDIWIVYEEPAS